MLAFSVREADEQVPAESLSAHWAKLNLSMEESATTEACRCQDLAAIAQRHGVTDPERLERVLRDGLAVERLEQCSGKPAYEISREPGSWQVNGYAYYGHGRAAQGECCATLPEAVNAALKGMK